MTRNIKSINFSAFNNYKRFNIFFFARLYIFIDLIFFNNYNFIFVLIPLNFLVIDKFFDWI